MNKKMFQMITAIIGAVATIISAVVTYVNPAHATAIVTCVGLVATCITECLLQFVVDDKVFKK